VYEAHSGEPFLVARGMHPSGVMGNPVIVPADLATVRPNRGWFVGLGLASMALGVLAILLPLVASLATTFVIGWLMLLGGVLQCYHAVKNRAWAGADWAILAGVVQGLAGVVLILFPVAGTLVLTLVLAGFFVASGVLKGIRAAQHRHLSAWGWLLFDGLLSLALGVLILAGWPSTAVWALGLLVGIDLIFGGSSLLAIAIAARPALTLGD
jgi:uncharacterized membrane protein HdeD (DUF308 family)